MNFITLNYNVINSNVHFLENNPCDPNPCNQGHCHFDDHTGNTTCVCSEGYKGILCDGNKNYKQFDLTEVLFSF